MNFEVSLHGSRLKGPRLLPLGHSNMPKIQASRRRISRDSIAKSNGLPTPL